MSELDRRDFRNALGAFATGVTIVTSLSQGGEPVGVTASSFNSVSLDPPMVLWSLAKTSHSLQAFEQAGHFAVHVLSCEQEDLSNRFARSGEDKFGGIAWERGRLGSPLLQGCAGRFQCKTAHLYDGGDHVIMVGEVVDFEKTSRTPLVFHAGAYAETRPRTKSEPEPAIDGSTARFTDEFFSYLLARAYFQASAEMRGRLRLAGLDEAQYFAMALLSMNGRLSFDALLERLAHTSLKLTYDALLELERLRIIRRIEGGEATLWEMRRYGGQLYVARLSESKSIDDRLLSRFTPGEVADLKYLLRKLIAVSSDVAPPPWDSASAAAIAENAGAELSGAGEGDSNEAGGVARGVEAEARRWLNAEQTQKTQ